MRPNVSRRAARRLLRLLRGEISSCGGATSRGGVREYVRGDAARRGTLWGGTAKDAERSPALTPSAEGGERPSCAGPVLPCLLREGRTYRGRAHVGLVRTPRAEFPPSSCVRFQCVIKSRPWPEPSSPKAPSPRQSNSVGRKVRKAFSAFASFVAKMLRFVAGSID